MRPRFDHQHLTGNLLGRERGDCGLIGHRYLDHRCVTQVCRRRILQRQGRFRGFQFRTAGIEAQLKPLGISRNRSEIRRLKIAVVADRLQACATELRGDVLGGQIEPTRRRSAPFQQIGGEE